MANNARATKQEILKGIAGTYSYHSRKSNRNSFTELEIKLQNVDEELFSQLYSDILSQNHSGKLEQSLVAIRDIDSSTSERKEFLFRGTTQLQNPRLIRKSRIKDKFINNLKVSISQEDNIRTFNTNLASKFRFRFRSSIVLQAFPDWRADFTITKFIEKGSDEFQNLSRVKSKFFEHASATKLSNFLNNLEMDVRDIRTEIEFEWIGNPRSFSDSVLSDYIDNFILPILGKSNSSDDYMYHELLHTIASRLLPTNRAEQFKSDLTLKHLISRPLSFTRKTFSDSFCSDISNYYVSDKADGLRCLVVFTPTSVIALLPNSVEMFAKNTHTGQTFTVCDAEFVDRKTFYLFDTLIFSDESVTTEPMTTRFEYISKILKSLPRQLKPSFAEKQISQLSLSGKEIRDTFSGKRKYPVDGLVFTQNAAYFDMKVFKWKPAEKQTIDFLVKSPPASMLGVKPYITRKGFKMYWLFNGIRESQKKSFSLDNLPGYYDIFNKRVYPNLGKRGYYPIQFSIPQFPLAYIYYADITDDSIPADLDGRVVELSAEISESDELDWIFHTVREDKEIEVQKGTNYGNNYQVASHTFGEILDPISIDELAGLCSDTVTGGANYFQTQKKGMYKPGVKFNSFVVAQLLRTISGSDLVVDLAAGRGNHLWTYNGFQIESGVFLDIDKGAIADLESRIEALSNPKLYMYNKAPKKNMKIMTKVVDLSQNYQKTLADVSKLDSRKADAVVITFAIHYLIKDENSLVNVFKLVDSLLKPGGVFIFTCFSGERVFQLLTPFGEGQKWDYKSKSGELQYSIKKLYKSDKPEEFGQKISLIHPFSKGEYYEEYLVNIDTVVKKFTENGYSVQQNGSFGDWLYKFQRFNTDMYYKMTDGDKLYCSLYQYVSLRK